jgi:hypothetical protein
MMSMARNTTTRQATAVADGGVLGEVHLEKVHVAAHGLDLALDGGGGGVGRGADCAVGHRGGVIDKGNYCRAQRREAEADQQRGGQSGRGAEAGSALDERAENEADENGLDTAVGGDVLEHTLDGDNGAGMLERVHNENCAEDDYENADGIQSALDRERGNGDEVLFPHKQSYQRCEDPCQRQGLFGAPVEADHKNDRY